MTIETIHPQQFLLFENESEAFSEDKQEAVSSSPFSNYIVYVDESGDHGLQNIDDNYPVFVLAFCVFHKRYYSEKVVPALEKFKFNHFGHDHVILHEHEIRKEKGFFTFFRDREHKSAFIAELTSIIEESNFILMSCVIDKVALKSKNGVASNPYHLALGFCLETLHEFLQEKNQEQKITHVVVECRGDKEDKELELEFRRICDGENELGISLPFNIVFANKMANSSGLQLADLVARPVGLRVIRPTQENRAYDVLKRKFYCDGGRKNVGQNFENWGLKIFPPQESEKPR